MRDFKNMKRQRGRNRSGGGQGGGGRPQQNANRAFESNGPDNVKIRGHAQHVFEKYQQLARDAFSSGDRVLAENYLQHADHYFRLLRTIQPTRSPSEILGRDTMASGLDIDFEEEVEMQSDDAAAATGEGGEAGEGQGGFEARQDNRQDGGRQDGNRQDSNRQDGNRQNNNRQDRYERNDRQDRYDNREGGWRDRNDRQDGNRQDDNRQDGSRQGQDNRGGYDRQDRNDRGYGDRQDRNRAYGDRSQGGERTDRYEGQRNDRYEGRRDNRRFDNRRDEGVRGDDRGQQRDNRYEARPEGFAEGPQPATPEFAEAAPSAPVSPSAERTDAAQVLRSEDGGMSEAPAFLQAASAEGDEARPRVRRRRAPRSFQGGDETAETATPAAAPPAEDA